MNTDSEYIFIIFCSRLSTDHHGYSRAKVHLSAFRRVLAADLGQLGDSRHWAALTENAVQAWEVISFHFKIHVG